LLAGGGCALGAALGANALVVRPRPKPHLDEIIDALLRGSQTSIVGEASELLRRGAAPADLLAAAFLAPILSAGDAVDPHPIAVVPSIFEYVAPFGSRAERMVPTLWAVWNAQAWSRKERAVVSPVTDASERAVRLGVEASHLRGDPHVAILAAQSIRALAWIDHRYAGAVLATVEHRIESARPREALARRAIRVDENDTTSPKAIAEVLMSTDHEHASGASLDGRSSSAIWQALCLVAIETRLAEGFTTNLTGGRGLHQTTLLDALWFIHDRASPEERPFILASAVDRTLEGKRHGQRSARFENALERVRANETAFVDDLRREVAMKGTGEHDFKFFAAVAAIAPKLEAAVRERWWAAAWLADPVGSTNRWHLADAVTGTIASPR
jgi:hypothetical protein